MCPAPGQEACVLCQVGVALAGGGHEGAQLGQREHAVPVDVGLLKELVRVLERAWLVHCGRIPQRPDGVVGVQHPQPIVRHYGPAPTAGPTAARKVQAL